jgi:hypothetical protein
MSPEEEKVLHQRLIQLGDMMGMACTMSATVNGSPGSTKPRCGRWGF